jgi:hypothetical protein
MSRCEWLSSAKCIKFSIICYPFGEILFRAAACTGTLYEIELYVVWADLPDLEVARSSGAGALYPVFVHRLAHLLYASFRPRLAAVALAFSLSLHLHQVGRSASASAKVKILCNYR